MPPSIVQIMIESPKEPPRGDFSTDFEMPEVQQAVAGTSTTTVTEPVIEEPIDVNVQGDTSKVFYDYDPDDANEIVILETLAEESPKSEDIPMTALPEIPVPMTMPRERVIGTEPQTCGATMATSTVVTPSVTTPTMLPYASEEQQMQQPTSPPNVGVSHIPTSTSSSSTSSNEDSDKNR